MVQASTLSGPAVVLVEACVTSAAEAVDAERAGADRVELCAALETGGLTPSSELLREVREAVDLPVLAMVRCREGGFVYEPEAVTTMCRDAGGLLEAGADGVVFGALTADGRVDDEAVRRVAEVAGGAPLTFHKAFDEVRDPTVALRRLEDLGVDRVLTAGGPGAALENRAALARLQAAASGRTAVMAGGSVRAGHVVALVRDVGLTEVHARVDAIEALVRALLRAGLR